LSRERKKVSLVLLSLLLNPLQKRRRRRKPQSLLRPRPVYLMTRTAQRYGVLVPNKR
jgi:hypothetical protein